MHIDEFEALWGRKRGKEQIYKVRTFWGYKKDSTKT
jgi:hypothetical protein